MQVKTFKSRAILIRLLVIGIFLFALYILFEISNYRDQGTDHSSRVEFNLPAYKGIHKAVIIGDIKEILNQLNVDPSNINKKDNLHNNLTPLHIAIAYNQISSLEILLMNSADINARCKIGGMTPLHFAVTNDNRSIHEIWQEPGVIPMLNYEIINMLIENGADLNIQSSEGKTPLHDAVSQNNLTLTRLLLKNGANTNLKDNENHTPIQLAVENDEILNELLKYNK